MIGRQFALLQGEGRGVRQNRFSQFDVRKHEKNGHAVARAREHVKNMSITHQIDILLTCLMTCLIGDRVLFCLFLQSHLS